MDNTKQVLSKPVQLSHGKATYSHGQELFYYTKQVLSRPVQLSYGKCSKLLG